MKTGISYADWLDWLAFELTFVELYKSATSSQKQKMKATLRRLGEGIDEAAVDAFVSQIPNFEQALSCYSSEEREAFVDQLKVAVTEFSQLLVSAAGKRD
ncbi:MAG: hypothetical protein OXI39_00585 [Gemmatimonadota bacterium]|uniref:hypothetical protein n=1 Tax=Candidatus Palauibacter scopulicola TaxID=3056741 RepID=UPI002382D1CA|nr:hypothetical protein [Candidatus Palauibacter scopulicola]MDE2661488.1 hypothetical protein [Candidatus Palauibacter scopulicola]